MGWSLMISILCVAPWAKESWGNINRAWQVLPANETKLCFGFWRQGLLGVFLGRVIDLFDVSIE